MSNAQIATHLRRLGALLSHERASHFKARSYIKAAAAIERYPERLADRLREGHALPKIPGVGASISAAIQEVVASGRLRSVDRLADALPPGTAEIAAAAKLSIRDATRVLQKLEIATVDELREQLAAGRVGEAVGVRLEQRVRQGLAGISRMLWKDARSVAQELQSYLAALRGVARVEIAGSVRRGKDTVGTIRLLAECPTIEQISRAMHRHGGLADVAPIDAAHIGARLAAGPQVVVRVARPEEWGTALVEETGSAAHLQEVAARHTRSRLRSVATEEAWYRQRGLSWVPPELREGRGEVEFAAGGLLPDLIELSHIRGDLHAHTDQSDGSNTLEEMAAAAQGRGYEYLAITDHSKSLAITNGLDEKRVRRQMAAIDRFNESHSGIHVFKGSEVDILEDGTLDFDDSLLRDLDVVIASIHSRFALNKEQQTRRMLRAIENRYVTCIGHLTGRKLLKRPGYELDIPEILRAVKRHGKLLEINASPDRLDISDELARHARALGIPLLINTDAHHVREFEYMPLGVQQARRGWQSAATVLNTLPLEQLKQALAQTRSAPASPRRSSRKR